MDKFQKKLEKVLLPLSTKLSNNKVLAIIRDSFIATMPLTIAGSLSLIIQYFPFIDKIIPVSIMNQVISFLDAVSSATLSLIALFLAGAIGYYYSKSEEEEPLFGIIIAICSFLIVTPTGLDKVGSIAYIPMTWLGGQGLFTAMIIGFASSVLYTKLIKSKFTIKMPDSVPPMVAEPFKALVPAFITFIAIALVRYGMSFTPFNDIHTFFFEILQKPLVSLGANLPASIIIVIVIQLLWFMGLHGQNIAAAVMNPIWTASMVANLTAVQNGQAPQYIFATPFFTGFVWFQFISLIIACLLFAKSNQLKTVGKISIGSACFNISEPIVFGSPVVLNFTLLVPWVLTMVVFVLITWGAMASGICPLPLGTNIPWTTPPILSGWLITGSPMGAVVQIVEVIVGVFIYLPFVKVYDKQLLKNEKDHQEMIGGE